MRHRLGIYLFFCHESIQNYIAVQNNHSLKKCNEIFSYSIILVFCPLLFYTKVNLSDAEEYKIESTKTIFLCVCI